MRGGRKLIAGFRGKRCAIFPSGTSYRKMFYRSTETDPLPDTRLARDMFDYIHLSASCSYRCAPRQRACSRTDVTRGTAHHLRDLVGMGRQDCCARSASVLSPCSAPNATFALKAGVWFRAVAWSSSLLFNSIFARCRPEAPLNRRVQISRASSLTASQDSNFTKILHR